MLSRSTRPLPALAKLGLALGIVAFATLVSAHAWAQGTGKISGEVLDKKTGRAIAFANIRIPDARTGALSDSKGDFLISGVPAGSHQMIIEFTGYADVTLPVVVTAGQVTPLKVAMDEIIVKQEETFEVKG